MHSCFLGIDIGTSGTKTLLLDQTGLVLGAAIESYPVDSPVAGQAEQAPESWWQALKQTLKQLREKFTDFPRHLQAIGLSGQMHGAVCLDARGEPLRPAIIWMDRRSECQVAEIYEIIGKARHYEITGNPLDTGFSAPSILWLLGNEPERMHRCTTILLPKDFIRYKMTNRLSTDLSDACSTGLLDVRKNDWSDEILAALNFKRAWFPEIIPSSAEAGKLTQRAARELGLPAGIPVIQGGGDQGTGALGAGILQPGDGMVTIATGGQVLFCSDKRRFDPGQRLHTFAHTLDEKWLLTGATLAAGFALRWFRENILLKPASTEVFDEMNQMALAVPPGVENLVFFPYLNGERTPYFDASRRGAFTGLAPVHTVRHMLRAVMEGVALSLRVSLEILKSTGWQPCELTFSGGGAKNPVWGQILADVLQLPLKIHPSADHSPLGAAFLAMMAAGYSDAVQHTIEAIRFRLIQPNSENCEIYDALFNTHFKV